MFCWDLNPCKSTLMCARHSRLDLVSVIMAVRAMNFLLIMFCFIEVFQSYLEIP